MSRRARELTVDQATLVGAVRKVSRQRTKINTDYVMSILRAREEGATFGSIAEAAGTSSQAVQEIVRRHGKVQRPEAGGSAPGPVGADRTTSVTTPAG